MPRLHAADNASSTLSANMLSTDTSLTVASAASFPAPPFRITIDAEIIEVGTVTSNTFSSLLRGQEGTTAAAHSSGTAVENRWTAGTYGELAGVNIDNNFSANQSMPAAIIKGLTGATAATRFVGGTASGAPTSGTFAVGDFVIDQTGKVWVCTTAGSPGTWTQSGGSGGGYSVNTVNAWIG